MSGAFFVCYATLMKPPAIALLDVPDQDLEDLLRAVHRGQLTMPLTRDALLSWGKHRLAEGGDLLVGLDERGLRAVLSAVLAERRRPQKAITGAGG